jgi:hypothetical protein
MFSRPIKSQSWALPIKVSIIDNTGPRFFSQTIRLKILSDLKYGTLYGTLPIIDKLYVAGVIVAFGVVWVPSVVMVYSMLLLDLEH